jgi:glycosyltransferase involved in cell wall biosynthesis
VQRHIIIYSPQPSYGYETKLPCPETEEQLRERVKKFSHVEWRRVAAHSESAHRGEIHQYLKDEDILIPIDADEVWHPVALEACLKTIWNSNSMREWRLYGMIHFWKSFNWACTDQMAPVRFVDLRQSRGHQNIQGRLYHFGYAQSVKVVRYKWAIHGHKPELRENWLEEKFIGWEPGMKDVHPTCEGVWNPEPFKKEILPLFLRFHPYYNLEVIG